MEKTTKKQAEEAVAAYLLARKEKQEVEARMKEAEDVVEDYCIENIANFIDNRLPLGNALISIKAGTAKPLRDGKALSPSVRAALAYDLPKQYVKINIDCMALYSCEDKVVRQMLRSHGVEIVREDKFVIV